MFVNLGEYWGIFEIFGIFGIFGNIWNVGNIWNDRKESAGDRSRGSDQMEQRCSCTSKALAISRFLQKGVSSTCPP